MKTKSNNKFFEPVKGGQMDGYTFKQHLFRFDFIGLLGCIIALMVGATYGIDGNQPYVKLFIYIFFSITGIVLVWKSLQHWKDLKNHTSR